MKIQTADHGGACTEIIYFNFDPPEALHQYNFLGKNFTDRQRIKRKINRWVDKLNGLPATERNAIMESLNYSTRLPGSIDI